MAKILVADDNAEIRKVIGSILSQQGLEIIEAADGESTYDSAVSEGPDLILLDILMPGMSGFDVLRKIKKNRKTKSIPVIMVTGLTGPDDEQQAMREGALDYIAKPWAPGELEDRIRIALPNLQASSRSETNNHGQTNSVADDGREHLEPVSLTNPRLSPSVTISTGSDPIDKALRGGLSLGSFTLLEGATGTGKSVMCQHLAYGALLAEQGVAIYVQGMTPEELVERMNGLGLDVAPNLKEGQLLIYPLEDFYGVGDGSESGLERLQKHLQKHLQKLPWDMNVIIIDALTHMATQAGSVDCLSFLVECKSMCRLDKAIVICLHTSSFDPEMLARLDALFGTHLSFRVEGFTQGIQMKTMNVLEIAKVKEAHLRRNNSIYFEVDPELGRSMNMSLKVLPIFKIKT